MSKKVGVLYRFSKFISPWTILTYLNFANRYYLAIFTETHPKWSLDNMSPMQ